MVFHYDNYLRKVVLLIGLWMISNWKRSPIIMYILVICNQNLQEGFTTCFRGASRYEAKASAFARSIPKQTLSLA